MARWQLPRVVVDGGEPSRRIDDGWCFRRPWSGLLAGGRWLTTGRLEGKWVGWPVCRCSRSYRTPGSPRPMALIAPVLSPHSSAIPTRYPRRTPPTHGLRATPHLYQRPALFIECNASERKLRAVHRQRPFLWTLRCGATNRAARARSSRPVRPPSLSRRSVGPPTGRGRAWLRSTRCAGCVLGYSASDRHGAERVC